MNKQQQRKEDLLKHYSRLAELYRICGADRPRTGKQLSVRLRAMENEGHRAAENYCNGVIDGDKWDEISKGIRNEIMSIFPALVGLRINSDARGYCLKIRDEEMKDYKYPLTTDWGGYGILSPES